MSAPALTPSLVARVVALVRKDLRRAADHDRMLDAILADPEIVGLYLEEAVKEERQLCTEILTSVSPRGRAARTIIEERIGAVRA